MDHKFLAIDISIPVSLQLLLAYCDNVTCCDITDVLEGVLDLTVGGCSRNGRL